MLKNTFCHIPSVGVKTEAGLWKAGVATWEDYLALDPSELKELGVPRLPSPERMRGHLRESGERHSQGDPAFFAEKLPNSEVWRLYGEYKDSMACVDIETTGLGQGDDHITTIALYDGRSVRTYVYGRNLEEFLDDVRNYKLLVTFNGKCFDVPFIERSLDTRLDMAHMDLRFVLKAAGVTGGLKKCEKHFGLDRGDLDGVDGYWAVLLWKEFLMSHDERVLETLLAYNVEDVLSLHILAARAYNMLLDGTPFYLSHQVCVPEPGKNPFSAAPEVIQRIGERYFHY